MKTLAIILLLVASVLVLPGCEDKVAVEIYKDRASGNFIYCRTGTLTNETHEYMGSGVIAASRAVEC